ncbi:MAG: exo-alpha-sialidase, partial [Phycisphaerales bacterium]
MKPLTITRRTRLVRLDVCFLLATGVLAMAATSNAESRLDGKTLLQQHSPLPARTPETSDPLSHHESPDERSLRLRMAPSERRSSPAQTWIRDAYLSIQVNVDDSGNNILNDAANEPSIAVDPTDPARIAIGWRQFDTIASNFRQAGVGYSADHGDTWTFPGVLDPGTFRSDPVLGYDAEGNFYYNSLAWPEGSGPWCDIFKSTDGGASWDGGTYAYGGDKQWMAIDRTGGIGHGNIYMNWTLGYSSCNGNFTRSYDNGATFEPCTTLPGSPFHGTCAVGPDGELYICGAGFTVLKSTTLQDETLPYQFDLTTTVSLDGSKTGYAGPNPGGLLGQVEIDVDCSEGSYRGNVYLLCSVERYSTADPLDVMFARSTNGGETWSDPVRINDDPADNGAWQWFGAMSVSPDDGRIDVTWNDTRNDPGGYDSELYYAYSDDGGATWSPNVALSPSFDPYLGWPQQNKLGDYNDMIS